MSKRSGVGYKLKSETLKRYANRCVKCGSYKNLEIHHIKPVCYGGDDSLDNLIPLCRKCHRYAPDDYIDFLCYLGSPYTPHLSAMRDVSLGLAKYFYGIAQDELKLQEFKNSDVEEYFKKNIEPIFISLNRLCWGYEEE